MPASPRTLRRQLAPRSRFQSFQDVRAIWRLLLAGCPSLTFQPSAQDTPPRIPEHAGGSPPAPGRRLAVPCELLPRSRIRGRIKPASNSAGSSGGRSSPASSTGCSSVEGMAPGAPKSVVARPPTARPPPAGRHLPAPGIRSTRFLDPRIARTVIQERLQRRAASSRPTGSSPANQPPRRTPASFRFPGRRRSFVRSCHPSLLLSFFSPQRREGAKGRKQN